LLTLRSGESSTHCQSFMAIVNARANEAMYPTTVPLAILVPRRVAVASRSLRNMTIRAGLWTYTTSWNMTNLAKYPCELPLGV
jgi:hypothetical protein